MKNNIKVSCFTNIDSFEHSIWTKEMCSPPKFGDYVEDRIGKRLKIVAISHTFYADKLIIELNR